MKSGRGPLLYTIIALAVTPLANATEPTLAELFHQVDPSVVEIATVQRVVPDQGPARRVSAGGLGSGFLISADGQIITAAHVVQVADEVSVRYVNGEVVTAKILASDPGSDVALIKAASVPAGIIPAVLGDSDAANVGDSVFVVGAPYGIAHSLTVGHVSARRTPSQLFGGFEKVELLQTDAAINQGNSGGPLFNMQGEVIGIVSHILSTTGGFQGMGFVVTSNLAKKVLLDEPTGWNGLDGVLIEGSVARPLNLPQKAGILVERVAAGSPASAIGLQPGELKSNIAGRTLILGGDIILKIYGVRIGDTDFHTRIRERRRELRAEDTVEISVLRDGEIIQLSKTVRSLVPD
jgi:S1-C subfamily serine protease